MNGFRVDFALVALAGLVLAEALYLLFWLPMSDDRSSIRDVYVIVRTRPRRLAAIVLVDIVALIFTLVFGLVASTSDLFVISGSTFPWLPWLLIGIATPFVADRIVSGSAIRIVLGTIKVDEVDPRPDQVSEEIQRWRARHASYLNIRDGLVDRAVANGARERERLLRSSKDLIRSSYQLSVRNIIQVVNSHPSIRIEDHPKLATNFAILLGMAGKSKSEVSRETIQQAALVVIEGLLDADCWSVVRAFCLTDNSIKR